MAKSRRILGAGLLAAVAVGASLSLGTAAQATPAGPGVVGTIEWQKTVGNTDFVLRSITIPPHQSTGWHYHDGTLYGQVKQGTLSHFDADCEPDGVYRKGSFIEEPSGAGTVHIGVNRGDKPVVLEVLYVLPKGSPLSEDAPNPGCDFQ